MISDKSLNLMCMCVCKCTYVCGCACTCRCAYAGKRQLFCFLLCTMCVRMCICVCVCVLCILGCGFTYSRLCMWSWRRIFHPIHCSSLYSFLNSHSQTPKLTIFPGWLTSKLPESSWLCLPRLVIQEEHPCLTFYIDAGVLNLA